MSSVRQSAFTRFLKANPEAVARWKALRLEEIPSVFSRPVRDPLVPLYGTARFEYLTPAEKESLYRTFIQLNAEGNVLFEQLLLFSFRKRSQDLPPKTAASQALQLLLREEYFHTLAFRRFLRTEEKFGWPGRAILTGDRWGRKFLLAVTTFSPLSLLIWGAKIEAYSLSYAAFLKNVYGGWDDNRWVALHHLHLLDEAHHVALQYDLYNEAAPVGLSFTRKLRIVFGVYGLVLALQWMLFAGAWRMVAKSFPNRSALGRAFLTFQIGRWCVRRFEPYAICRSKLKALFLEKSPILGRFFAFIYW